jgi:hypothetical protein
VVRRVRGDPDEGGHARERRASHDGVDGSDVERRVLLVQAQDVGTESTGDLGDDRVRGLNEQPDRAVPAEQPCAQRRHGSTLPGLRMPCGSKTPFSFRYSGIRSGCSRAR